ncbi:Placental protein 11 [Fasciola gigantica]|uniref:Uridylate-specific endoribonuclease n=1 Tax=Fasciola gigantica TaxID=46835 RepID=A0A504Z6L2_FASGI|nr:Placental protein 11 [Fasciola gigantica]
MHIYVYLVFCFLGCSALSQDQLDSIFSRLWELDKKGMEPYLDEQQPMKDTRLHKNKAPNVVPERFFSSINFDQLKRKKTIAVPPLLRHVIAFINLMDNYHMVLGIDETTTPEENVEINSFLEEVMKTEVMRETFRFLKSHGLTKSSELQFKEELRSLWFLYYRRKSSRDSSAFEHVFVGEIRDGEVSGYHNWIKFAMDEKEHKINYREYIKQVCGNRPSVISLIFRMRTGALKPFGSMFIGTSPELEMALYTVAFLSGVKNQRVKLGTCNAGITCHKLRYNMMGSCFVQT